MITEVEEQKIYLEIKKRFINEKGLMVFIEANDWDFSNPKIHYLKNNDELCFKVNDLCERNGSYAIFDYTLHIPTYHFHGQTFAKQEEIAMGRVTYFDRNKKNVPMDIEKVKEELKKLGEMLRDPEAS